ncbi:dihydroxyacetone kinase subunit L [Pseudoleptotrichia goodfellowii]|uniref:DAK2 domain protein n=1 Tax=Pseudoleptotrichia goodfellowii F0264 TaxID=596323 RepID=D0GNQ9_9FUSO|nr:dihydroxyacetone kinase subunit L [Pseudoleptotrichia goodfellowii]EEY34267.1 DAK2 domain protein [Pseudoleptotrichia goodfellowii F0264]
MNLYDVKQIISNISILMKENKDYLLELDSKFGDGDLGISMVQGFDGINEFTEKSEEKDLGKLFFGMSRVFNEMAPSSLGTIISFWMLGIASNLKGKEEASKEEIAKALEAGISKIKERAGSKENEKTILDALVPATEKFEKAIKSDKTISEILKETYDKAAKGSENTKEMKAVHGRAAYHDEKTLGHIDGGAYVGKLIFEGIYNFYKTK